MSNEIENDLRHKMLDDTERFLNCAFDPECKEEGFACDRQNETEAKNNSAEILSTRLNEILDGFKSTLSRIGRRTLYHPYMFLRRRER